MSAVKKVLIRVFFVDDESKVFAVDPQIKVSELAQQVATKLELRTPDRFKLFLHRKGDERCLDDEESPVGIMVHDTRGADAQVPEHVEADKWKAVKDAWESHSKFVYKCRIFLSDPIRTVDPTRPGIVEDPALLNLYFIQAVHDVISGVYRVQDEMAVELAGLQMQVEYGDHKPDVHKHDFLRPFINKYVPAYLVSQRPIADWESSILRAHASRAGMSSNDARATYLECISRNHLYGATLWHVKLTNAAEQRLPENMLLAVNQEGILLLEENTQNVLISHSYSDIYSWAYKHSAFAFVSGTASKTKFQFDTRFGKEIASTLQAYVNVLMEVYMGRDRK